MKTNKTLIVSMIVITAFILSSCNSSLSIVKRRYNNGYYVSISKGVNTHKEKQDKEDEKSLEKESIENRAIAETLIDHNKSVKVEKDQVANENLTASIESKNDNKVVQKVSVKREYEPQGLNAEKKSITKNDKVLIKKLINENKKQLNTDKKSSLSNTNVFEVIFAIILPPLAVFLHSGIGKQFWISLILTLLFWVPGVIYAFIVILS